MLLISGHQWSSVVISGHQRPSHLGGGELPLLLISGHQWSSVAISGHQWQSVAITGAVVVERVKDCSQTLRGARGALLLKEGPLAEIAPIVVVVAAAAARLHRLAHNLFEKVVRVQFALDPSPLGEGLRHALVEHPVGVQCAWLRSSGGALSAACGRCRPLSDGVALRQGGGVCRAPLGCHRIQLAGGGGGCGCCSHRSLTLPCLFSLDRLDGRRTNAQAVIAVLGSPREESLLAA